MVQALFSAQSSSGRPISPVVAPYFVSTFSAPVMSVAPFASSMASSLFGVSRNVAVPNLAQPWTLVYQPFVVGLGFSPVPAKLVAQILAGKYMDLSELLPASLQYKEPKQQLLLDGPLVLTSQPKKPRCCIDNITTWLEAFAIFAICSLILVSHFPRDLLQYQLLILRTHQHFNGHVSTRRLLG